MIKYGIYYRGLYVGKENSELIERFTALLICACLLGACTSVKEEKETTNVTVSEIKRSILTDDEVKEIAERSYQLLQLANKFAEQNQRLNTKPFLQELQPYFTKDFINNLEISLFTVPIGGDFPADFNYKQHFVIKQQTSDKVTVETAQASYLNTALFITVEAKKEDGNWKIDNYHYERPAAFTDKDKQQTFITKEKAENIVKEYLHGDDKEIESITSGKGNTYYINAFVKVNARQKIGTSIKMDRTSGEIQSLMQVNS